MDNKDSDPLHYIECIELQLSEIDILKSMFPDSSEFSVEEQILRKMNNFKEGSKVLPPKLEYYINLCNEKGKVNLSVALPISYPSEYPEIYVRSDQLSRQSQLNLNTQLSQFMNTLEIGDLMIGSIVAWLQEHKDDYLSEEVKCNTKDLDKESATFKDDKFLRMWIYSHHIYSKVKRKDIKDLAEEYHLTGFCLPGKPGIICVEGLSKNINEWWHLVRSWNWQKILCKKQEEKKISESEDMKKYHRFEDFQELGPNTNIRVKSSGFHVDMGDLFRYLESHNSGYMFEEYFGVAGK